MDQELQFLKSVLSVPTKTYQEGEMVKYLISWCNEEGLDYEVDQNYNVYVTKKTGEINEGFYYPCVVAHTDTVHNIDIINVVEEQLPNAQGEIKLALKAYNDQGQPTGIGGDDKAGVFACLTLLKELPFLKAAFFVSEETGCHGSQKANTKFFENVGYVIQFDAPENWMITERCFGQILFDRDSEFFEVCDKVLSQGMIREDMDYMTHPYTDVWALRSKFDFSCINFSIGYYNYHTKNEYVVVEDVYNGINMGRKMIENLGYKLHYKQNVPQKSFNRLWE
jgi:acetylornithine deacetylase/succinyl-diaminopimelate desuccinylase-like protein